MSLRPGSLYTIIAAALIGATGLALERTATEALPAARPAALLGVILGIMFLVLGSARWIVTASLPLLGAVVLEAGFGEDPSWVRAILIGCLWFAALEMSWEAIDRRKGATYTRAASAARVQEVATVVGVSLLLGLVASASASFAPARSVALQATVLAGLLIAFVLAVRSTAFRPSNSAADD